MFVTYYFGWEWGIASWNVILWYFEEIFSIRDTDHPIDLASCVFPIGWQAECVTRGE